MPEHCKLWSSHKQAGAHQILLVGKHKDGAVAHEWVLHNLLQKRTRLSSVFDCGLLQGKVAVLSCIDR